MNNYRQYWCRATESDWPELLTLGVLLGVLVEHEGRYHAVTPGDFVYPVPVLKPTGETVMVDGVETPVKAPVRDANGNLYVHGNLITTIDIRARAEAMAVSNPELASALSQIGRYFVTDAQGQPKAPDSPAMVWAV